MIFILDTVFSVSRPDPDGHTAQAASVRPDTAATAGMIYVPRGEDKNYFATFP
jgi:hypothetical protein